MHTRRLITVVSAAALTVLLGAPIQAQEIMIGVRGGPAFSHFTTRVQPLFTQLGLAGAVTAAQPPAPDFRTGASFGFTALIPVQRWIMLQPEVSLAARGSADSLRTDPHLLYLEFPILARLRLDNVFQGPIRPLLYAGPSLAFLLSCQHSWPNANGAITRQRCQAPPCSQLCVGESGPMFPHSDFDVAATAGVGFEIDISRRTRLDLDVRYQRGMLSVDNGSWTGQKALNEAVGVGFTVFRGFSF